MKGMPDGWHSVTTRLVVEDVDATIDEAAASHEPAQSPPLIIRTDCLEYPIG